MGNVPFAGYNDPGVAIFVSKGKRPTKPRSFEAPGMSLAVWKLAERCWHADADERPEVKDVLQELEEITKPGECTHEAFPFSLRELNDLQMI